METPTQKNMFRVLDYLLKKQKELNDEIYVSGKDLVEGTGLSAIEINDSVDLLHDQGLVDWFQTLGTAPFNFNCVKINARGKYELERRQSLESALETSESAQESKIIGAIKEQLIGLLTAVSEKVKPPIPIGSPYGFTDQDWEIVASRKAKKQVLFVVLGCKFESDHYDTDNLKSNLKQMFEDSVTRYNSEYPDQSVNLEFIPLHAGYGEHLFNGISRDIISSDISVFETSDSAPNVFIELGVALTWGSRVFLIKKKGCEPPPSDISGQTYADYTNDAKDFEDPEHSEKLYRMVERAIQKKG
jgi:hypothetical protein